MKQLLLLCLVGVMLSVSPASASCIPRSTIVDRLQNNFNEKRFAGGLINEEAVAELFLSDTGSWTIIITDLQGNSCVLISGIDWDSSEPTLARGEE